MIPWGFPGANGTGTVPPQPFTHTIDQTFNYEKGFCTNLTLQAISSYLPAPASLPVSPAHASVVKQLQWAAAHPEESGAGYGLYVATLPVFLAKWPARGPFKPTPTTQPEQFGGGFIQ